MEKNECKPKYRSDTSDSRCTTYAQLLVDKGRNVGVRTVGPVRNTAYVDTWNTYAVARGRWVKFIEDLDEEDEDYFRIDVGMPTSSSSSSSERRTEDVSGKEED